MREAVYTFQPGQRHDGTWPKDVERRWIEVRFTSVGSIDTVARLAVRQVRHAVDESAPHGLLLPRRIEEVVHQEPEVRLVLDDFDAIGPGGGHLPSWLRVLAMAYHFGGFPEEVADRVGSTIYWEVFRPWQAPWVEQFFPDYWRVLRPWRTVDAGEPLPEGDNAAWRRCPACTGTGVIPYVDPRAVFAEGPAAVLAVFGPSDLTWCLARIRKLETALRQALAATESGPLGPDLRGWEVNLLHARLDKALAEDP